MAGGEQLFGIVIFGGLALLILVLLALGRFYPGSGADQLDWRPTHSVETEAELELDDVAQMLEAQNEMRERRGRRARSLEEIEAEVSADRRRRPTA